MSERTTPAECPPAPAWHGSGGRTSQGWEHATTAEEPSGAEQPIVVVARTGRGWSVFAPGRADDVDDLVEGMTLADLVMQANGGNRTVPTLLFPDGSALTNPSIDQVKAQLAQSAGA